MVARVRTQVRNIEAIIDAGYWMGTDYRFAPHDLLTFISSSSRTTHHPPQTGNAHFGFRIGPTTLIIFKEMIHKIGSQNDLIGHFLNWGSFF